MVQNRNHKTYGDAGEDLATQFLVQERYRILCRNFRCRHGEIDIIAESDGYLCFIEVKKTYPLLELHIIGLSNNDFKELPKDVFCHGFLRKENKKECTTYYNLLLDSKIFINPTPKWGGYSSTIESMFYYTPIIISPYKDFVEEFGTNIDFGLYNEQFTIKSLKNNINSILSLDNIKYMNMCSSSHNKVKNYTWTNYVKWIIEELNTSL